MDRGYRAANRIAAMSDVTTILDVGCGTGEATDFFLKEGKKVTSVDIVDYGFNVKADYMKKSFEKHDLVWACHILEHQLNVNIFLSKCRKETNKYICVTVPPLKHNIVGGHLTLWNAGILMYNLVLAGFDCSTARILQYGYNLSIIAEIGNFKLPELNYDNGDIEKIAKWLPKGYDFQGFNGNIMCLNW